MWTLLQPETEGVYPEKQSEGWTVREVMPWKELPEVA